MSELDDIEFEAQWEAVRYRKVRLKPLMRVYQGGVLGIQYNAFCVHVNKLAQDLNFEVEVYSIKDVSEAKLTEAGFAEWLLASDVHFILSHPHQGEGIRALGWHMTILDVNLQRLKYHKGFPTGIELTCPVFLQNKYEYLKSLGAAANPTLRIDFIASNEYEHLRASIERYTTLLTYFTQYMIIYAYLPTFIVSVLFF